MPSSVIADIFYDAVSATLRITYVSGKIYDYHNVPKAIYDEMKAANSKGTFLNRFIKGKYPFKKVN
jgi:hypothetical protein